MNNDIKNPTIYLSHKFNEKLGREMCSSGPDRTKLYTIPSYIKNSNNIKYYWVCKDTSPMGIYLNSKKQIPLESINKTFKKNAQNIQPCPKIEELICAD